MSTKPDLAASPDDQSKPTMTGAVPLIPLGRPQVAAAARLVAGGARHPVRLAGAGLRLTGELASAAPDVLLLEGSGATVPSIHAHRTICVTSAARAAADALSFLGPFRLLRSNLVVCSKAT